MGCRILCFILLCGILGSYGQQLCTLIVPNVLYADTEETIVVDGHNTAFDGLIIIYDFPLGKNKLLEQNINVNKENGFLGTAKVKVPSRYLETESNKKWMVSVNVKSPSCNLHKVVLMTFQGGFILIQTNKPIYTPGSTVLYRIFTMDLALQTVSKPLIVEFMTPENIIVSRGLETTTHRPAQLSYRLSEFQSVGVWTIMARFNGSETPTYIKNFEVKEYVLPSIEVKLKAAKNFLNIKDQELRVEIYASYLSGKPVYGKAFVLFGMKRGNEDKKLSNTLRTVQIINGKGTATLERRSLVEHFQEEREMLQWTLYVAATVVTHSGSDMVKAELDDIHIVTFPYKIIFTKTVKYFKPGMPYDLVLFVTYPDGSPAHGVLVVAQPGRVRGVTDKDGTVRITLNTRSDMTSLKITVTTTDPSISNDQQASATMVASAYTSIGGNYMNLKVTDGILKPGDEAVVTFSIQNADPANQAQITHFNFMILNKGRIIKVGRQAKARGQAFVSMFLPVTSELIPSFRMVAYYMVTTTTGPELVSDSIWVDVADSCVGALELTGYRERDNAIAQPDTFIKLKLRADHKAIVGLVAMDKGLYVHNSKFKMSQKKVWDSVENNDVGCTPGGGANTLGVFYDAGLALHTSFQITTPYRSEPLCQLKLNRRRRSLEEVVSGNENNFVEDDKIISRTEFPESWFWKVETMMARPDSDGISTKTLNVFLKDSITTWEFLAVSMSENKGLCVSQPYEIQIMKNLYIDLKLPNSIVRNEQVEIQAVLYNPGSMAITVRIKWILSEELCSLSKDGYQYVTINSASSVAVPLIIVPLTLGYYYVEVKAAFLSNLDGVRKEVKVVREVSQITQILKRVILDPEAKGKDGIQREIISTRDIQNISSRKEANIIITMLGNPVTEKVDTLIDGINLKNQITAPHGNGEQNMMTLSSNVIAVLYLDSTGQWERAGVELREKAIQYILEGVVKQLAFSKTDASYAASLTTPSSTWLTAYAVKVFALATNLVKLEEYRLCNSVKWLIQEKQKPDGSYQENAPTSHTQVMGGIKMDTTELDSTLTAFVLIAMLESESICAKYTNNIHASIDKASAYLTSQYKSLRKPYSITITSYALTRTGKLQDTKLLMSVSTGNSHWLEPDSNHISLEGTSYALLTLLEVKQYKQAGPLVRWITEQKFYGDVSVSLQATNMVFQALAQYYAKVPDFKDFQMEVSLGQSKYLQETYRFTRGNAKIERMTQTSLADIVVTARGNGLVNLKAFSRYSANESGKCNNFDLSVTIKNEPSGSRPEGAKSTVSITICTRFLQNKATISILDIAMMTGFSPDFNDLHQLKSRADRVILNFEINKASFDRGILTLYMDKISHAKETCLKFNLHQYFEVGLIQPASVTIYEYNAPENRCTKFYHVKEGSKLLGRICAGEVCRCVKDIDLPENCFLQQQLQHAEAPVRLAKACDINVDYVFKTTLTDIQHVDNYDTYVMTVTSVIREGTDVVPLNDKRNFISHAKCQKALKLQKDKDYLIIGLRKDVSYTESGLYYSITKDTWIEMWPNDTDCQNPETDKLCKELSAFQEELMFNGCS